jgi:hypothetical protein
MTTSQEMDQQFGDGEIERRLKLIEDKVNGYDAGGMDLFRQFGYFQLSNLPRFDQYGVQIQTSAAQTAAIFFLENFVANPIGSYPQAAHFGQVSATTVLNMLTAALSASSASTLSLVHTGTTSTLQFLSTNQVPAIIMTPGAAGDPASLQDGMLWYNQTTNKFYIRVNGATVELGGGGGSMPMPPLVSSLGWHGLGKEMRDFGTVASATWPNTNQAFYIPITVTEDITVVKLWCFNGATASGNVNMSLYDSSFAQVANTEIGSTAQAGTNVVQAFDITDTALTAGLYYLAIVMDNTTGTIFRRQAPVGTFEYLTVIGMATEGAAFNLPATATPVAVGFDFAPLCGLSTRTLVT